MFFFRNILFEPDLMAEITPKKGAAGFILGSSIKDIVKKIGRVNWYESNVNIYNKCLQNHGWIGSVYYQSNIGKPYHKGMHSSEYNILKTLIYKNNLIRLSFNKTGKLYVISLGLGYGKSFYNAKPGDNIKLLEKYFKIYFDNQDDVFYLYKESNNDLIPGICFSTNYRASLEEAPEQIIEFISIHDWSLQ